MTKPPSMLRNHIQPPPRLSALPSHASSPIKATRIPPLNMLSSSRIITSNASRIASIARPAIFAPAYKRLFHASRPAMTVHVVKTADEFRQAIANNNVVIVDSYADWCPPCKAIAPVLEKHSNSNEFKDKVHFVKFDVDHIPEISKELRVSSIPAFFFFKDGKQVDKFVGANPAELQRLLKTHSA